MKRFLAVTAGFLAAIGITYFLPYGTWAELDGLPAHPLIVHSVVVLLPLLSLFLLLGLLRPQILKKTNLWVLSGIGFSTVAVLAAKSSGDSLAAAVGLPVLHAEWGNNLVPAAMALFAAFALYALVAFYWKQPIIKNVLSALLAIAAVGNIAMTYFVGHSGAEAAWKAKYEATKPIASEATETITFAEVRQHNTATDCWTVVGEFVYDVTRFVNRHPAGSSAIEEMCGTNASEDFLGEHSGQTEPEKWLASLRIGRLSK